MDAKDEDAAAEFSFRLRVKGPWFRRSMRHGMTKQMRHGMAPRRNSQLVEAFKGTPGTHSQKPEAQIENQQEDAAVDSRTFWPWAHWKKRPKGADRSAT